MRTEEPDTIAPEGAPSSCLLRIPMKQESPRIEVLSDTARDRLAVLTTEDSTALGSVTDDT